MTAVDPALLQHDPLHLSGTPEARGLAQADCAVTAHPLVKDAIGGALQRARADGLLDAAGRGFLAAQMDFYATHGPGIIAEIDGIAQGFGISRDDLFAFHHLRPLELLKTGSAASTDGCSSWAVASGPDGPLLVKNRDSAARPDRPQCVMMHEGADICGGAMICVGTLGSPGAYSSGMNARGLAVADTHVTATGVRIGWLRLFLATHLLTQCATVDEALAMIAAAPHAGGGTLLLADAGGAVAAVEFGPHGPMVQRESPVWRTNHFTQGAPRGGAKAPKEDAIDANSLTRFVHLAQTLPGTGWDIARAKTLMATHEGAPICQHRDPDEADTLSTAIFVCRDRLLIFCDAAPCTGVWHRFPPDTWSSPLGATPTSNQ